MPYHPKKDFNDLSLNIDHPCFVSQNKYHDIIQVISYVNLATQIAFKKMSLNSCRKED